MKDDKNFPLLEGIPCVMGSCVFPDQRDKDFSQEIVKRLYGVLQSAFSKYNYLTFQLSEQYGSPREDSPHFQITTTFSKNTPAPVFKVALLQAEYRATNADKTYKGTTVLHVQSSGLETRDNLLLLGYIFGIYDEEIRKHYPDWDTEYVSKNLYTM